MNEGHKEDHENFMVDGVHVRVIISRKIKISTLKNGAANTHVVKMEIGTSFIMRTSRFMAFE
jgi:hypothetical protein